MLFNCFVNIFIWCHFVGYRILGWQYFSFPILKMLLYSFQWEICSHLYLYSPVYKILFSFLSFSGWLHFLWLFLLFSLSLVLSNWIIMCLGVIFFKFLWLGFFGILGVDFVSSLDTFQPLFLWLFFPFSLLSSPSGTYM